MGGIDFALVPDGTSTSSLGVLQTDGSGTSFDIPVAIAGATTLYTLINSTYGEAGDTVGTVEVKGTGGLVATFSLVEGTNIRDFNNDGYEDTIAAGTPSATFGDGQVRLDMQTLTLPSAFASATITDIILTSEGGTPQGNPFLAATTVATTSGPSQLVLLGSGVVPDSTSSASTTVVSGGSAPGTVSVALDPASDSGVKGDDLTNVTTPTFDVTINEAGSIELEVDGTAVATQAETAAGVFTIAVTQALADGPHTITAIFTPTAGAAVQAGLTVTIDTEHPSVVQGPSSEQGPLYSLPLTFSEAIEPATLTTSNVTVVGPGDVNSPVAVIQGNGTAYALQFNPDQPLVVGGTYTVAVGSGVADAAGNALVAPTSESFTLVPDTTPPTVASVSPSGEVSTAVSSISVAFDKAIIPSTFTAAEVAITGPDGAIPTSSITVTEVDASDYKVSFPEQSQQATYDVSIGGPGVQDVSGVGMTAAYLSSFTIDLTPPTVVTVTPTGTVNAVVSTVDVTFSKPIDASTLNASNVTLTGPDGPITVGQGYLVFGATYAIPFATQRAVGAYQLTIGSGVQDPGGHALSDAPYQSSFALALPDLTVNSVTPSVDSAHFGDTITVSWGVTNDGDAGATGPWTDDVYLSTTSTLGSSAIFLGSSTAEAGATLAPSASYTGQATVQLPDSTSMTSGTYDLIVVVDAGGVVNESDLTTQTGSTTIGLAAAPPPDLATTSVTSTLTAGQPGQSETVTWSVENVAVRRRSARGPTASTSRPTASSTMPRSSARCPTATASSRARTTPARSRSRCRPAWPTAPTRSSSWPIAATSSPPTRIGPTTWPTPPSRWCSGTSTSSRPSCRPRQPRRRARASR